MPNQQASQDHGHDKTYDIVINGTPETATDHRISYEQIVLLAFPGASFDVLYTVTYANQHGHDGSLAPGQSTTIKDGTEFDVIKTNRS